MPFLLLVWFFPFKEGLQKLFSVRALIKDLHVVSENGMNKKRKKKNLCSVPTVRKN